MGTHAQPQSEPPLSAMGSSACARLQSGFDAAIPAVIAVPTGTNQLAAIHRGAPRVVASAVEEEAHAGPLVAIRIEQSVHAES